MNFSSWAVRNPIPVILLFILLCVAGIYSFKSMAIEGFPDIELPIVTVSAALPGASPTQLQNEVARKIENSLANISGIYHLYTHINDGAVTITVEFHLEKDAREALDNIRDAVNQVRSDLPAAVREPTIVKSSTVDIPLLTYTVASVQLNTEQLSEFIDNEVTKRLAAVSGVGQITRLGGANREIQVEVDPVKLAALNISIIDVSRQLQSAQQETPSGQGNIGGAQQQMRTVASLHHLQDLARQELVLPDGRKLRLDQIAQIKDSLAERSTLVLLDGRPVVSFQVKRTKGASEVGVAHAVRKAIAELNAQQNRVVISEAFNTIEPIQASYDGSLALLYEGAILAVIVIWWFLRDWRATIIAALALPLSIIPTFVVMQMMGFSLNTVTLLALALVIGILVDDAIVEVENIVRHIRKGRTPYFATLSATNEIGLAVIATTFTLIAVFLPTAFMSGVAGKYFKQFGWTAVIATAFSLLVARLVTPILAAYFLRPSTHEESRGPFTNRYLSGVEICLRHRNKAILAALIFFIISLSLLPFLPTGFLPPSNTAQTSITLELPPGSTLNESYAIAEQARLLIQRSPHVKKIFAVVGSSADLSGAADSFGEARTAVLTLKLASRHKSKLTQSEIENELRQLLSVLPGVRVSIGEQDNAEKLSLTLASENEQLLKSIVLQIEREIRGIEGLGSVSSTLNLVRPEVFVAPNFAAAADLGVNVNSIGDTLRIATAGDYEQSLAKFNLQERQIPIRVRLPLSARHDIDLLTRLPVAGKNNNVMLGNVANLSLNGGPAQIERVDRRTTVTLNIELNGLNLGTAIEKINSLPTLSHLPTGIQRQEVGDAQLMNELFSNFGTAMALGILCIYIVLVLLFHDFLQPLTILVPLPLSIGGAFAALWLTRNTFSLPSLIGLLMLMGIVVKNSILLVDYAIVAKRKQGVNRFKAMMMACYRRSRPILMTSIAMCAGMLPIALGFGADSDFRAPMAVAVMGGLITSTILSLFIVPVVYTHVVTLHTKLLEQARAMRRLNNQ